MDEIIFECMKLAVMSIGFVVCAYLLPYVRQRIGADKMVQLEAFVKNAVYAAQQLLWEKTGEERRLYATDLISEWCIDNNVSVDASQIRTLIEAAVRGMRIAEGTQDDDK